MAGERSKSDACLSNLRALGLAIRIYAEQAGTLPGGLFPLVHHGMLEPNAPVTWPGRELTCFLRNLEGDTITDRLVTCPVMSDINPDASFATSSANMGRTVYPAHYALNNWGPNSSEGSSIGGVRTTNPLFYFGYPTVIPELASQFPPARYAAVANPDREWMLADAWYRSAVNTGYDELQQEGPYQSSWSGEALPYFAPHLRRAASDYVFTSSSDRSSAANRVRQRKSDGATNTVYFDGHAASVPSQTYVAPGGFVLLYGFPGTANPAKTDPPASNSVWSGIWR